MVTRILLVGLITAGLTSCATYRTGQTPDDVYYSPERPREEYVQINRDEDDRYSYNDRNLDDRRLRQQIRDPRFRFDDDIYWNTPRYNSWGWNTWNNPYNTWGWNSWNSPYNSWAWNSGWNTGFYNKWSSPYICIPGGNNLIVIAGPGAPKYSTGIRYSAPIQRFPNSGTNFTYGKPTGNGSGSRYFGNNTNSTRNSYFGGNNNNSNWSSERTSSSRSWGSSNNNSSSGSSSRSFSSGSSSSGSSSSSSGSSSGSSAGGRRN
ncbi:hypothetical protein IQ13_0639 [Lacibacter cauensis]|uniref:Uncharacterized protein n=1 Tax=Lacibacter cauensis TaxID=510947 RepID=A0A562SW07_9BACT|nr:hypothetical protein [Lacibacter cauensis]TWI85477.1 hypothetical protein IQ13_0639 [Lacibacter cauensis]